MYTAFQVTAAKERPSRQEERNRECCGCCILAHTLDIAVGLRLSTEVCMQASFPERGWQGWSSPGRGDCLAAGMISKTSRGRHRADSRLSPSYRCVGGKLRKAKDGSIQYCTLSPVSRLLPSLLFSLPPPVFPPSLSSLSFFPSLAPTPSPT